VNRDRPPPLDSALEALLESEREATVPPGALDRVWSRVALSVVGGVPRGEPLPNDGASGSWPARQAMAAVISAFVAGGAVGATLVLRLRSPPSERIVYVDRWVPAPAPALRAPRLAGPTAEAPSATSIEGPRSTTPPPATSRPSPSPSSASTLEAERSLLDEARSALSRGDALRALSLAESHIRRFGHPQLAEEREALAIQALVSAGRYEEARGRAARFRTAWPSSLFLPAVEASVASIP
jgi:hypothetical protein